eukprot:967371-Pelagomonas_calceolata.AAC.1
MWLGTCSPFWKYHADLLLFIGWAYTWSGAQLWPATFECGASNCFQHFSSTCAVANHSYVCSTLHIRRLNLNPFTAVCGHAAPPGTSSENTQTAVKRVLDQLDGERSSAYLAGADLDSFQISGAVSRDTTPPALDSGAQAGPVRTAWRVLLGAALGVVLLLAL